MQKGKAGGDLRRFYVIFGIVAAVGIAGVGYAVASNAKGNAAMEPVDLSEAAEGRRLTDLAVPVVKGMDDAPVTIIVFEDYYCSHCAMFSLRERPRIESDLVATGKARLVYYDFPLDPRPAAGTFLAARAARCAGDQGRFWEYQDILYRNQLTWGVETDKLGTFQDYGETLGLDRAEFRGCLNSDRHAEEVSANRQLGEELGLTGTPSVLVGTGQGMSRQLPNYGFETIRDAVEAIISGGGEGG